MKKQYFVILLCGSMQFMIGSDTHLDELTQLSGMLAQGADANDVLCSCLQSMHRRAYDIEKVEQAREITKQAIRQGANPNIVVDGIAAVALPEILTSKDVFQAFVNAGANIKDQSIQEMAEALNAEFSMVNNLELFEDCRNTQLHTVLLQNYEGLRHNITLIKQVVEEESLQGSIGVREAIVPVE